MTLLPGVALRRGISSPDLLRTIALCQGKVLVIFRAVLLAFKATVTLPISRYSFSIIIIATLLVNNIIYTETALKTKSKVVSSSYVDVLHNDSITVFPGCTGAQAISFNCFGHTSILCLLLCYVPFEMKHRYASRYGNLPKTWFQFY